MSTPLSKKKVVVDDESESVDELGSDDGEEEEEKDDKDLLAGYMPEQGMVRGALKPYIPCQVGLAHDGYILESC